MVQTTSPDPSADSDGLSVMLASARIHPDTLSSAETTTGQPPPVAPAPSVDGESPVSSFVKNLDAVAYGGNHCLTTTKKTRSHQMRG